MGSQPPDWRSMRELRQARGLSQTQLAEESGVSERTVRAIERGDVDRPQRESLRRIADVLSYGDGHAQRLLERWTGVSNVRTPQEIGIPGWESLYQRIRARTPEDGGRMSSVVNEYTLGPDYRLVEMRCLNVHEAMSPSGPPVVWKLAADAAHDVADVEYEVRSGGVLDELFVHSEVAALAIRPEPAIAQNGPFVIEYFADYRDAQRSDVAPDREIMFGTNSPLRLGVMIVRFTDTRPDRVSSVLGSTRATAARGESLPVAADGSVQLCLHDFVGVFGLQWE